MASGSGTRIPYYSNPDVIYEGTPIGVGPPGASNSSSGARTLTITMPVISGYQATAGSGSDSQTVPVSGFENGHDTDWVHQQGVNGSSAVFSEENTDVHAGSKALKVDVSSLGNDASDVRSLGPNLNLIVGEEYTLSYWAKTDTAGKSVRMVVEGDIYLARSQTLTTDWEQYSWTFIAQETNPQFKIHYYETGTFFIDDIELLGPAPTQHVLHGFAYDPVPNTFDISISGAANTAYVLAEAEDLDFSTPDQNPIPLAGATASVGSLNLENNTIVTDPSGNASVQGVSLGATAKDRTFIRAESGP